MNNLDTIKQKITFTKKKLEQKTKEIGDTSNINSKAKQAKATEIRKTPIYQRRVGAAQKTYLDEQMAKWEKNKYLDRINIYILNYICFRTK